MIFFEDSLFASIFGTLLTYRKELSAQPRPVVHDISTDRATSKQQHSSA